MFMIMRLYNQSYTPQEKSNISSHVKQMQSVCNKLYGTGKPEGISGKGNVSHRSLNPREPRNSLKSI